VARVTREKRLLLLLDWLPFGGGEVFINRGFSFQLALL
jgi:hypothetical protein